MSEKQATGIFTRFNERKHSVNVETLEAEYSQIDQQQEELDKSINELTDKDMPDIATLDEDSDYSMFMSSEVSNMLKKKALRKLFLSPSINVLDGLNDYDENYTTFELLGNIIPHDLKQELERQNKEKIEETLEAEDASQTEQSSLEQQDIKADSTQSVPTKNGNNNE
ncbi:hypothetical protein SPONN_2572 [uncultured Candidatus Thioglobus sp.]|nr:hypothetical protein SPONN_2572 [uncultured Candidatus Thioglobus sp.]SMM98902.1 hypothetical protein SPONL_227 [uncultured Candidatus Thioglobus sp.]